MKLYKKLVFGIRIANPIEFDKAVSQQAPRIHEEDSDSTIDNKKFQTYEQTNSKVIKKAVYRVSL